ncbi:WapI family immunity protein [Sphingobacterium sp. NPDC055431]
MELDEDLKFEINASGNFIRITPIHRIIYFSDLDWDKNVINTRIEVKAGGFIGSYETDLTTFDFKNLKEDLSKLYNNLNEKIIFNDLEGYLQLIFEGDNTGNFTIQITCIDQPGIYSAKLKYEMLFDQTYIKPLIKILDDILKQYPIVGDNKD